MRTADRQAPTIRAGAVGRPVAADGRGRVEDLGAGSNGDERADTCARVRVRVPSKVNLFLAVRGLRDDGYHELVSIMQTVGIHDTVTVELEGTELACRHPSARRFMELAFSHDAGAGVPDDGENLAVRAARLLMEHTGTGTSEGVERRDVPVTRMTLAKRIPVAAGMAGGSADAAATWSR